MTYTRLGPSGRSSQTVTDPGGNTARTNLITALKTGGWINQPAGASVGDRFVCTQGQLSSASGLYNAGIRTAADLTWSAVQFPTSPDRIEHFSPLANHASNELHIVGEMGCFWSDTAYTAPTCNPTLVFQGVGYLYTPDYMTTPLAYHVLEKLVPGGTGFNINSVTADAYRDTNGLVHVIYITQTWDAANDCGNHSFVSPWWVPKHAVLNGTTVVNTVSHGSVSCVNQSRIIQDASGRFHALVLCGSSLILYDYATSDTTGTGSFTNTTTVTSSWPNSGSSYETYITCPRSGSALQNYVDIAAAGGTGNPTELSYARLDLTTASFVTGYTPTILATGLDVQNGWNVADGGGRIVRTSTDDVFISTATGPSDGGSTKVPALYHRTPGPSGTWSQVTLPSSITGPEILHLAVDANDRITGIMQVGSSAATDVPYIFSDGSANGGGTWTATAIPGSFLHTDHPYTGAGIRI